MFLFSEFCSLQKCTLSSKHRLAIFRLRSCTVCFFLSKSRSMAVIWGVYRRLLRLPAGKTSRPVQRPRCPCVAPSRRFSRISEILGAHSPPDPSAERASAPSEPKRGRKSSVKKSKARCARQYKIGCMLARMHDCNMLPALSIRVSN